MKKLQILFFAFCLFSLISCNQATKTNAPELADAIYYGGDILTMKVIALTM
jgi:hypothetical protein